MSFIEQIRTVSEEHQLYNYNKFNLFQVMFKQHDEKYLHSRFISFLLDPHGSHQQGSKFLELFFEVMDISNFSLEGVKVNPTEKERGEIHNIDILIRNAAKQAIIIENKFLAKDQTRPDCRAHDYLKYQLSRYYYRLAIEPQGDDKFTVVKIIYLTIDGKDPEDFKYFPEDVKPLVSKKDHLSDIARWLDLCINELHEDSALKRSIQDYKQARFEFLNDVQLALKLKKISGKKENLNDAFHFWNNGPISAGQELNIIREQFIHIKWHTVHEFYSILSNSIKEHFVKENVQVNPIDNKLITRLTHKAKPICTSLTFEIQGHVYYVCNDQNGFSIGRHKEHKSKEDYKLLFDKKYAFFDFSKPEVFQLMSTIDHDESDESENLAGAIVTALRDFVNK